jgi:sulfatase modifying factor 1
VTALAIACLATRCGSCSEAGPKRAPTQVMKTNSLGMKLVFIAPGEFMMGASDSDKDARPDESPRHRVRITHPFYMGAHEVTVGEFRAFVHATGHKTRAEKKGSSGFNSKISTFQYDRPEFNWRYVGWKQTENHPVLNVNWFDACAFCKWLSHKEGRTYRLPTEAEWEYACRAGSQARFLTGDSIDQLRQLANVQDKALTSIKPKFSNSTTSSYLTKPVPWNDKHPFTAPVASFKRNRFGLYDTLGNVAEWCSDWYGEDYYKVSPRADPTGPSDGTGRVVRGGAFLHQPQHCRVTWRISGTPSYQNYVIGFRVVADIEHKQE